jgi:hypothetical protein
VGVRVIVAGSRDWLGIYAEAKIQMTLNMLLAFSDIIGEKLTIVHGNCPTGADAIVDRWCRRREDQVGMEVFTPVWKFYGKGAGPIRDKVMVDEGADMCLVFLKDGSRGATTTAALAREAKIPTFIVPWEETE